MASEDATAGRTAAQAVIAALKESPITRASFLRLVAGVLLVIAVGPAFYRWIKGAFDTGGSSTAEYVANDGNRMLPPPAPLPDSAAVVGGGAKGNFRIYTVTEIPSFSSDTWKFAISGLVDKPNAWNWEQFLQMKRTVQVSDFHCVTGWSVYKCTWEGIPLKQLLAAAGVQASAKFVKFYSGDKVYTDALSLSQANGDDIMVAVLMDGKPIPQQLGGPVRLIVPQMYAYKSVKWLQGIELIEKEHMGYWEVRGYDNDAWVGKSNA
ncbi:molybdopterin-dependent oxidoreductase [Paenibacillus sp. 2RAB27]|uniref:molybdopterin-dependent oxidoreductase n=1 Tax=Paenibacillus sp. 2RAB27 TaxID=3232991 RepID=UPI003F9B7779